MSDKPTPNILARMCEVRKADALDARRRQARKRGLKGPVTRADLAAEVNASE